MKKFIITVDTEGDNLWAWKPGDEITTENAKYIDRFQVLCEEYGFPPVYLCDYEMIQDHAFCKYIVKKAEGRKCEIGMHLHAWNTPPEHEVKNIYGGQAYITEYSKEQVLEKHIFLHELIKEKTGIAPVCYRSGRWATNETLFEVLEQIGIHVDCSVVPGITMENCFGASVKSGNSYVSCSNKPYRLNEHVIEVPMTAKLVKSFKGVSLKNRIRNLIRGKQLWLRPAVQSTDEMLFLVSLMEKDNMDYLEFMIHSSELMPGGSPYAKDKDGVEKIYRRMVELFEKVSGRYQGVTLADYYDQIDQTL